MILTNRCTSSDWQSTGSGPPAPPSTPAGRACCWWAARRASSPAAPISTRRCVAWSPTPRPAQTACTRRASAPMSRSAPLSPPSRPSRSTWQRLHDRGPACGTGRAAHQRRRRAGTGRVGRLPGRGDRAGRTRDVRQLRIGSLELRNRGVVLGGLTQASASSTPSAAAPRRPSSVIVNSASRRRVSQAACSRSARL